MFLVSKNGIHVLLKKQKNETTKSEAKDKQKRN
jgi:hypothetical protein